MTDAIVLTGVLDQYAAEEFKPLALPLLMEEGDAVLEFAGVERIHGAFLQVLLALKQDMQRAARNVVLRGVGDSARECFRVAGAEQFFQFTDGIQK